MLALRILLGILLVLGASILVIPSLVLFDLVSGGTGWGLCEEGIQECDVGYFAGLELIAILALALFVIVGLASACARAIRHLEEQQRRSTRPS